MERYLGIEMVAVTNMLRRIAFHDVWESDKTKPTGTQQWILSFLWENCDKGDIFQKDLEANFQIRGSTATEILKGMERKGLIIREPVSYDRRAKKISLTDTAIQICEQNKRTILEIEESLSQDFTNKEIDNFFKLLDKIKRNIERIEDREP